MTYTLVLGLHLGLGLHHEDAPYSLEEIGRYSSLIHFILEHGYTLSIAASQLSLLALFRGIFSPVESVRYSIYALTTATTVWFLVRVRVYFFSSRLAPSDQARPSVVVLFF